MTWFRIDDTWGTHPKVQECSAKARLLWVYGGLYCAQHLTDGTIPKKVMTMLAATASVPAKVSSELVDAGLWVDHGDRFEVHDFLTYQPTRERVTKERAAAAERQQRARDKARESRRDESVSHAPPDPTRPDPCGSTNEHHQQPVVAAKATVDEAVALIAEYHTVLDEGRGKQFEVSREAYARGIANRINDSSGRADLAERLSLDPSQTAEELRDWYLEPEPLTSLDDLVPGLNGATK